MEIQRIPLAEIDPAQWDQFVMNSPQGMIFSNHQYLCNLIPGVEAMVVSYDQSWLAVLPFGIQKRWGLKVALQPLFSQFNGIMFANMSSSSQVKKLELQKEAIYLIADHLPFIHYFNYYFSPEFDYALPLKWKGLQAELRATYRVPLGLEMSTIENNYASHVRREIKKAISNGITVVENNDIDTVIRILKTAKEKVVQHIPDRVFDALKNNATYYGSKDMCSCFIALKNDTPVAGIVYFRYKNLLYYYQGSTLQEHKNSGAMSLIIHESMKKYHGKYEYLDFDGSMVESIERFFRGFGSKPVYFWGFSRIRGNFFIKTGLRLAMWLREKK